MANEGGTTGLGREQPWPLMVLEYMGGVTVLAGRTLAAGVRRPFDAVETIRQIEMIGVNSLLIVVLTAIFSSLVMTVQTGVQLARFGAEQYVGNVVSLSLVRELAPVLTALLLGGRVGAGIAAEIGSMNVTEQIDAIRSMGADPVKKLVLPRVAATVLVLPLLTTMASLLGVLGAMVVADLEYNINPRFFYNSILITVTLSDYTGGVTKTLFFGFFISLIACFEGLHAQGGTEGVGRSTTRTVVVSSVVTVISDFILTSILLSLGL